MRDPAVTVRRILKVNHAGEFGAIRIYGAQIAVAKRFFPDIAPALIEMRADESPIAGGSARRCLSARHARAA